jgi:competence protein ComEC
MAIAVCGLVIGITQFLPKRIMVFRYAFGAATWVFFFFLGVFSLNSVKEISADHFTNQVTMGENTLVSIELSDQLTPNAYNTRFYAEVRTADSQPSSGKLLVLFKRADSINFQVGDRLLIYDDINIPSNARNPGDFNYNAYLQTIDVYGQVYVDASSVIDVSKNAGDLSVFLTIKQSILEQLALSGLDTGPRSMIEALVLGQRQNVDPEITRSFRDAGVIHILALSGLHVGIILLILRFITQRMTRWRYGRWMQSILIIFLLWSFAILTGMSPSIMRAVTMFSFVAIGMNIKRKASTFHSLTLSAFFLLLVDARLLFQVGFQLSYMAVFAIVLLQPLLRRLWNWHHPVKNFFWNILTVTVAAQIGVAPLSMFYFHQLPGLFLLGNMMLLPVLPLIIGAALLLIALLLLGIPHMWLVIPLNFVLHIIIDAVEWISSLDQFIFKDIYLELYELVGIYVVLFSVAFFVKPFLVRSKRERFLRIKPSWWLHIAIAAVIGLVGFKSYLKTESNSAQLLILHQARGSAASYSNADRAVLWTDFSQMDVDLRTTSLSRLENIATHRHRELQLDSLKNSLRVEHINLQRIDSTGIWVASQSPQESTIIWLSGAPKINLERLILEIQPKAVISDGSNYRSTVDQWKKTCAELEIPFYNTYEDGAIDLLKL